ncbi:unnamed protein product [Heligmosomoides polygyrus]|uniref:Nuclear pore complex protein n=1 Tax=Heligmosomoides polygyrus TaxID=6339 RepID=A0A183FN39_HELPZ|nr:unnamed protein product [Heligmosomoides polygyrus]
MTAIFSEDDRDFFNKFTTARKADCLSADILSDVHNVLSNKETGSTSKGVHTHHPSVDFVILTAMLEAAYEERMAEIVKAWMVYFDKKRVRYLLLTFVILSELERGSKFFEAAVNFVAKTMSPDEKLFDFYLNEIDGHLRGKYGVLRILLKEGPPSSDAEKEAFVNTICDQLENKLDSQLIANAASDLVATMVVLFPTSARLQNLLVQNMVHHVKCIHTNTLRWLGRFEATKESGKFLRCLQHTLRESFAGVKDDIWPPRLWETEDVSCIDPRWDSEEAEDVFWEADRVLDAYLNVSTILHQRFRYEVDSNDPLVHAGLKWHLPEVRLSAFQLWTAGLGKGLQEPENNHILEEFILSNASTSMTSLRKAVEVASNSCSFSPEGKLKWEIILTDVREREKLDEEQRGMSFLPDDLSISEVLQLPPAEKARERLEELLQLSGSHDSKSCPAFPDLYENLVKAGYDQRVFARFIIVS